jgi:hypothetical protein
VKTFKLVFFQLRRPYRKSGGEFVKRGFVKTTLNLNSETQS